MKKFGRINVIASNMDGNVYTLYVLKRHFLGGAHGMWQLLYPPKKREGREEIRVTSAK